ncbi:hypothetical protein A0H76_127 [Hepatospora eriocheir]|uniref:Uncharacterized protein n=1 Tax=Hepatospora eriocheir TaxID=1081669 RepID=A0A1X0QJE0_9MICR|nr:hypothetical protein A0H76_127 [Hepatospora eriocheir]
MENIIEILFTVMMNTVLSKFIFNYVSGSTGDAENSRDNSSGTSLRTPPGNSSVVNPAGPNGTPNGTSMFTSFVKFFNNHRKIIIILILFIIVVIIVYFMMRKSSSEEVVDENMEVSPSEV